MRALLADSLLVIIDVQPKFMAPMPDREAVTRRCAFLVECAGVLGVPVLATEQVPERMGGTDPALLEKAEIQVFAKTAFSAFGCEDFVQAVQKSGKKQLVLVGVETHICVTQTALDALAQGYEVHLATDAITGRGETDALQRLAHAGAQLSHTESVVYEWMEGADHPKFREILAVVKEFSVA